ncbi:MAG: alpha/beta hydrolase-fold protein [Myxococcota bacterium]|nr:alpha/beta hydrolase-fold protein [Myxococcota bacterium]
MKAIRRLALHLAADPHRAHALLRAFTEGNDFPLVDGGSATFFFWDGHPADAVYLLHWVQGLESRQAFHRLEGTDAFWFTIDLPRDGRVEYKFELHRNGQRNWIRDPHNDRLARDPFGANSVCPMPGYQEPRWAELEPGMREGSLDGFDLESAAWGDTRRIEVYLPSEYKPHKTYPLLICHDGSDYLRFAGIKAVLDNLMSRKEMHPTVVAFTSGSDERNVEYGANPAQVSFLVDELLPALSERYGVSDEPLGRALMGASFGGVASLFTAWSRPGVFGRLFLQSGSFVFTDVGHHGRGPLWDPVVEFMNAFRRDPARIRARVFMSCGTFEGLIFYNRALAPLMRQSGLDVRFVESHDGHNWVAWRDRLRDGLSWTYPGHLWMTYE